MSGDWAGALEKYARIKHPANEIPASVYLSSTDETVTIFDGYEKAKYHFLVMPRDPFPLSATATLPSASLRTLANLRKAPKQDALRVLRALKTSSDQVSAWIQDEMRKTEGWAWPVQVGFHANESMRHLHLHVISSDLCSPKLKNKKHYNSFHPALGFFLHLDDVMAEVDDGRAETKSIKEYDELLKLPLKSHYTDHQFANLPKLKDHLEAEFARRGKLAKAAPPTGPPSSEAKRSADDDFTADRKRSKAV